MSGIKSGVQKRLRLLAPSAIHCCCHQLLLMLPKSIPSDGYIAIYFGNHSTIHLRKQKSFLKYNCLEIKMQKLSDARWLDRYVLFEQAYQHWLTLLKKYIMNLVMQKLMELLPFQNSCLHLYAFRYSPYCGGSLQGEDIDLTSVSIRMYYKTAQDDPKSSTWFKDHCKVSTEEAQLGVKNIIVTSEE